MSPQTVRARARGRGAESRRTHSGRGSNTANGLEVGRGSEFADALSGANGLELVSEIAHDLRSPLTSILTLAETLRRGQSGEVNELQRRQLGLVYSAALALSSTASDMIELAHGGDSLAEERSTFSIAEIFESVHDIVRPMAEEKGLEIGLISETNDRRAGYPLALSRVILNLTTNAIKFTDEGSVEISARSSGAVGVRFAVCDTGRGIDPGALTGLYRPFRLGPGPSGYCFSGTGLGLAICRKLVEAMDSELLVETLPDSGTCFHFEVKLLQPDASF